MFEVIAAALAVMAVPAPALAQAASDWAVLECTYTGGGVEVYRVKPGQWQTWNSQAWSWADRPCVDGMGRAGPFNDGTAVTCTVTVSEDIYQWRRVENTEKFDDQGRWFAIANEDEYLTVDRRAGTVFYSMQSERLYYKGKTDTSRSRTLNGTCARKADPSLSPKPGPIL